MTAATYFTTRKAFRSEMGRFEGRLENRHLFALHEQACAAGRFCKLDGSIHCLSFVSRELL
jgi:hypothetical protein